MQKLQKMKILGIRCYVILDHELDSTLIVFKEWWRGRHFIQFFAIRMAIAVFSFCVGTAMASGTGTTTGSPVIGMPTIRLRVAQLSLFLPLICWRSFALKVVRSNRPTFFRFHLLFLTAGCICCYLKI